jgi:hypothetical protein
VLAAAAPSLPDVRLCVTPSPCLRPPSPTWCAAVATQAQLTCPEHNTVRSGARRGVAGGAVGAPTLARRAIRGARPAAAAARRGLPEGCAAGPGAEPRVPRPFAPCLAPFLALPAPAPCVPPRSSHPATTTGARWLPSLAAARRGALARRRATRAALLALPPRRARSGRERRCAARVLNPKP